MLPRHWIRDGKLDWYFIALSIPHYRTRMAVSDFQCRWSDFLDLVFEAQWERKFKKRHRFFFDRMRCNCGWKPRSTDYHYEDELDDHRDRVRETEWSNREFS